MQQLTLRLSFDGTCTEALRFYEKALGGKITSLMTNGQSPMADRCPPGTQDRVMHASIAINGQDLTAADAFPGKPYTGMHGFSICLNYSTVAQATQVFAALSVGGTVLMAMEKTFFADIFGLVNDRFGTPWMVLSGVTDD